MPPSSAVLRLAVTCSRGLEAVLRDEVEALGGGDVEVGRGVVRFTADMAGLARANVRLRTGMRVLMTLATGPVDGRDALYQLATAVNWEDLIGRRQTFAVEVAGRGTAFRNTGFAALTVKDAIADRLRQRWGSRPDVDRVDPDVRIHLHLGDESADLSLDSTGEPLSHRGWRPRSGPAPLAESLAAGILLLAGYDGARPLLDPMCGTGTIAIEAALIATRSAPGLDRGFAFERWPSHRGEAEEARREAAALRRPAPAPIVAADVDPRAVAAASRNARAAGVAEAIEVRQADVRSLAPPGVGCLIVTNPPYGVRLGEEGELAPLYRALGDALKQRATGCEAWVLTGSRALAAQVGLRPSRRTVLFNGPIECRLLAFELFAGRRDRGASAPDAGNPS